MTAAGLRGDSSGFTYPGRSGQKLTRVSPRPLQESTCHLTGGTYSPVFCNEDGFQQYYLEDIDWMEQHRWIDQQTSLVTVALVIAAPNVNMMIFVLYYLEVVLAD